MNRYAQMCLSDEELCLCGSDQLAAEELARRYGGLIRQCARPYYLAGGDWDDLQQEGFLGLLSAIERYRPDRQTSFKTFAVNCIRNRLISSVRSASAQKHRILTDAETMDMENCQQEQHSLTGYSPLEPEQFLLEQEALEELLSVLTNSLSGFEQQTLYLFLQGLSYHEIAKSLGKTTKSIDNAVRRIRTKLMRKQNLA